MKYLKNIRKILGCVDDDFSATLYFLARAPHSKDVFVGGTWIEEESSRDKFQISILPFSKKTSLHNLFLRRVPCCQKMPKN
jgi:hypothetical protein